MNKLPVFKLRIKKDDSSAQAVEYVALVDNPAIEMDWMAFNKQYKFHEDKERRMIMGALMVADMPIYRSGPLPGTDQGDGYYVVFDKETIYDIVQKFFRNGYASNFNIMHDNNQRLEGVYIIESMMVDTSRGVVAPKHFDGISDGSWIVTAKIDNEQVWNEYIKTGKLKGFSVEGIFSPEYYTSEDEKILETIAEIVKGEN